MKLGARFTLLALLLQMTLSHNPAFARTPFLNHPIGDTITVAEAEEYDLFSDVFGFDRALIFKSTSSLAEKMVVFSFDGIEHFEHEYLLDHELLDVLPRVLAYQDSLRYGTSTSEGIPAVVEPYDADPINGFITRWTGDYLLVNSRYGQHRLPVSDIAHVDLADPVLAERGFVWFRDPNNRLFFGPTGRSREFGHGYYVHHFIIMPTLELGMPFRTSIGGSLMPLGGPLFSLGWVSGQITLVETDSLAIAVGNRTLFADTEWSNLKTTSVTYGVLSFGDANTTLVIGGGIFDESDEPDLGDFLMIGGMWRVKRSLAIVTENYFIPHKIDPLVSFGVRWISTHYVLDVALAREMGHDVDYVVFPWISVGANF